MGCYFLFTFLTKNKIVIYDLGKKLYSRYPNYYGVDKYDTKI